MGIPRLSQDLYSYAEQVTLGTSIPTSPTPDISTTSLIIDGPSLVYLVYNKLLAYHSLGSFTHSPSIPTYAEINQTLHHLLSDFQNHGAEIQKIFFDGALPKLKRDVRLDRMEKLRRQLETYRQVHAEFPSMTHPHPTPPFESVLWETRAMSTGKLTWPAPPFMVASAIESLRSTRWRNLVHVIPEEADTFCAAAARDSDASILTNDSDLVIHGLGPKARVILLHSIEKKITSPLQVTVIMALALKPRSVAERLKVSSFMRFAFERSLDSSASTAVIRERARDDSRLERHQAEYAAFVKEYSPSLPAQLEFQGCLDDLDPRTAELIVDMAGSAQVYLTPMLEDPSRDSSWTYGAEIRQLAYSLLELTVFKPHNFNFATEHVKKGQRIATVAVPYLPRSHIEEHLVELLQLLDNKTPNSPSALKNSDPVLLLQWYTISFSIVQQKKLIMVKRAPTLLEVTNLCGLSTNTFSSSSPRVSWDATHLLANAQATLYSLRMLKQITHYILSQSNPQLRDEDHSNLLLSLRELHTKLKDMPEIEHLFLDIPNLRFHMRKLDLETRNNALAQLKDILDPCQLTVKNESEYAISHAQDGAGIDGDGEWISKKRKKKRRREPSNASNAVKSTQSTNTFSLLMEE
ncbi:uncharacterized protein Z518_08504 [Rhinocladiella mackenziei CBS 650.93]|uniref:Asteroid domain-containing protein n=1 Tax=Rhinocladiella mackenziei CBS 650.93 TaxID=1442369 RepID=A0A0D2GWH4_9EURO|nr:uncharacterized protein Z518_08504 [Rhinocladiella mackenziei CBS 650.93]KIX02563.1 hypothetical protein Z518_08504 [Rhinocladiella mackenziei CBS 650.93]